MRKIFFMAVILFFFGATVSLHSQWAKTYGGKKDDRAWSVIQDPDGTFVVAGTTESFGMGKKDMWVVKLSPEGKILWQRTCGDPQRGGSVDDEAFSVQTTRDGRYILAGTTGGYGLYFPDASYLKITKAGDVQWKKYYGNIGFGHPECNVIARDSFRSICQSADGGYIAVGQISWVTIWFRLSQWLSRSPALYFGSLPRVFAVRIDGQGAMKFQRAYGEDTDLESGAYSVRTTPDQGFLVAGKKKPYITGNSDFLLLKISSWGDVWQKTYGGKRYDGAWAVQEIKPSGYIVAGASASYGAGECDALVLRLDKNGNIDDSCGSLIGTSAAKVTKTKCVSGIPEGRRENYEGSGLPGDWSGVRLPSKGSTTVICKKTK